MSSDDARYMQAESLAADWGCVPENTCWPDCVDAALWSIERDHDTPKECDEGIDEELLKEDEEP